MEHKHCKKARGKGVSLDQVRPMAQFSIHGGGRVYVAEWLGKWHLANGLSGDLVSGVFDTPDPLLEWLRAHGAQAD